MLQQYKRNGESPFHWEVASISLDQNCGSYILAICLKAIFWWPLERPLVTRSEIDKLQQKWELAVLLQTLPDIPVSSSLVSQNKDYIFSISF